jgi:hypothetical protein
MQWFPLGGFGAIRVVREDLAPLDAPADHMMPHSGRIYPR